MYSALITHLWSGSSVGNYHLSLFNLPNVHEAAKTRSKVIVSRVRMSQLELRPRPSCGLISFSGRIWQVCMCWWLFHICGTEDTLCFCSCGKCIICKSVNWSQASSFSKIRILVEVLTVHKTPPSWLQRNNILFALAINNYSVRANGSRDV